MTDTSGVVYAPCSGNPTYLLAALPVAGGVAGAWIHALYSRKVRAKVGEIEVEAQTKKDVQELLVQAEEIQKRNKSTLIHEP